MEFYLFNDDIIIASRDKEEAEKLYEKEYGDSDYEKVEEIDENYRVGGVQSVGGYGYDEVYLYNIIEKNKVLPFIVEDIN